MPAPDPQPRPMPCRGLALLGVAALSLGLACRPDDDQANRALLATLPLDRRVDLLENLARFDALPASEQAAIRRLDATLAALPPDDQARFRALLQHYHVWFQGLTEEQRASLRNAADPEERARLAQQLRLAGLDKGRRPGSRLAGLRTGHFGLVAPLEMAGLLRVWLALPAERRAAIDRKSWAAIHAELRAEMRAQKIRPEELPADQEQRYDARLEANPDFRPLIEAKVRRVEKATGAGKADAATRAENALRRNEQAFAQFLYFEEHPPKAVTPDRLARFVEGTPEWLRAQTDSLSADDARAYYALLYRLVYASKEMPEPAPSKSAPGKSAAPRGGPSGPVL